MAKASERRKKEIAPGSVMKAVIRPGGGSAHPQEGDQILFHCTTRTENGVVVDSTRSECGGRGFPKRLVLGKSKMICGWEEGIPSMLKGEVAMLRIKSELHYGDENCPVEVPENYPVSEELLFEIELLDFFKVKIISDDLGVTKQVLIEGEGWETAREPYEVKAWITARTLDNQEILSFKEGEPLHFTFGKKEVPEGLERGVGAMTRKEKAIIYVNGSYLTAASCMPSLEKISEEVLFEVEIVQIIQVRDMVGDGRLIKRRIKDGKGEFPMDCPLQDSLLYIHYKGMLPDEGGKVFYDTHVNGNGEPLEFRSGEGMVPEGLEMCIRLMLPNEIALVSSTPDYAYDKFPRPENVPEGANIQWEVELLKFETPKDWTGMNFTQIMDETEKIKSTGNRLFKEGKYELAKAKYEKVLKDFNHVNPQDNDEGKIFVQTRSSLHLNVAACYQKIGEYKKALESCNKVLGENPGHVKALYRRGIAYMACGDFDEARKDFNMMVNIDKSSEPDATAALNKLRHREQEVEEQQRKQFKGLFDKKPGEISKEENNDQEQQEASIQDSKDVAAEKSDELENHEPQETPQFQYQFAKQETFTRFWTHGRNIMRRLGLSKCTIL
ncbi:hypothetical protein SUGI_0398520 [Cryptomeria japonica]|uniref:peptidyl-prolyl cis-trans isomerase PASTICCINO1 n=1 Tax=Cryptomeria japonica TaxID=3369 RepID=UPI002408A6C6|nr:peptidyl-prolyl cis-trans isomerase PASTICCINO1 [Cryptomeria japonica]GLJ21531.1 hypothetical protein SUGI_0398520 [Cryptomeria japonica]